MQNYFLNFTGKKEETVDELQNESTSIVDVFHATIEKLMNVNSRIQTLAETKRTEKLRLEQEIHLLGKQVNKNEKIIGNIGKILSTEDDE